MDETSGEKKKNNTKTFVYGFSVLPIEKVVVATQDSQIWTKETVRKTPVKFEERERRKTEITTSEKWQCEKRGESNNNKKLSAMRMAKKKSPNEQKPVKLLWKKKTASVCKEMEKGDVNEKRTEPN